MVTLEDRLLIYESSCCNEEHDMYKSSVLLLFFQWLVAMKFSPLFSTESNRFNHFSDKVYPSALAKPAPRPLLTKKRFLDWLHIHSLTLNGGDTASKKSIVKSIAPSIVFHERDIKEAQLFIQQYSRYFYAVFVSFEIDLLYSVSRMEHVFLLRNWCALHNIHFGAYVYQISEHVYVPNPSYKSQFTGTEFAKPCFDFYIVDAVVPDSYHALKYIITYLFQSGVPSRSIYVHYLFSARVDIQSLNLAGYFFRDMDWVFDKPSHDSFTDTRDVVRLPFPARY